MNAQGSATVIYVAVECYDPVAALDAVREMTRAHDANILSAEETDLDDAIREGAEMLAALRAEDPPPRRLGRKRIVTKQYRCNMKDKS